MAGREYEKTRDEIREAALRVLRERGPEGTTLETVAESLGYTKPALYYYFKSKEDLLSSLVLHELTEAMVGIREIGDRDGPARDKLRALIRLYLDEHFRSRGYSSILHEMRSFRERLPPGPERDEIRRLSQEIPKRIVGIMRQGIESGEFRKEDPRVLGGILFAMLSGVLAHLEQPILSDADTDRIRASLEEILIKGIAP